MGLETGTYVSDLVTSNPPNSDPELQGAAHLRLIKTVLQNTFPGATKALPFPTTSVQSVTLSVPASAFNTTYLFNTTGGTLVATLPTLGLGDAGWQCSFLKYTGDLNPYFIAPPSGTIMSGEIAGLARCRRCIPGHTSTAIWDGSTWFASRVPSVAVGSILPCVNSVLPVGYEWPNGQTLASASTFYPEFFAVNGVGSTPDLRGRSAFGLDGMGGTLAGRITASQCGIQGNQVWAAGGAQNYALAQSSLPNASLSVAGSATGTGSTSQQGVVTGTVGVAFGAGNTGAVFTVGSFSVISVSVSATVSANTSSMNGNVAQVPYQNMPPTIMLNHIIVVE